MDASHHSACICACSCFRLLATGSRRDWIKRAHPIFKAPARQSHRKSRRQSVHLSPSAEVDSLPTNYQFLLKIVSVLWRKVLSIVVRPLRSRYNISNIYAIVLHTHHNMKHHAHIQLLHYLHIYECLLPTSCGASAMTEWARSPGPNQCFPLPIEVCSIFSTKLIPGNFLMRPVANPTNQTSYRNAGQYWHTIWYRTSKRVRANSSDAVACQWMVIKSMYMKPRAVDRLNKLAMLKLVSVRLCLRASAKMRAPTSVMELPEVKWGNISNFRWLFVKPLKLIDLIVVLVISNAATAHVPLSPMVLPK